MHPTTLLAHHGLTPLPGPSRRRRAVTAPRRRPLRLAAAPRVAVRRRAVPGRLRAACTNWRAAAVALLLALVLGGLGILRVWPPFAVVMSGSMAPTINTGDMVVLERLRAPARIGEVVAVDVPDAARARYGYPPVVIHRVYRITPDGQIRTKGDARPQPDPFTVPRTAVDTQVVARIPSGGRVLAFFHSAPGLLWLAFGGLLFFGLPLLDRQREANRRDAEATADLRDQLAAMGAELARLHAEQERSRAASDATLDRLAQLVELACGAASSGVVATEAAPGSEPHGGPAPAVAATPVPGATAVVAPAASFSAVLAPVAGARPVTSDRLEGTVPGGGAPAPHPTVSGPATVLPAKRDDTPAAEPPAAGHSAAASERAPAFAARLRAVGGADRPVTGSRIPGAVLFALPPAHSPRTPAPAGRWDAPPGAAATRATGWATLPAVSGPRRFSRPGRLVAASQI